MIEVFELKMPEYSKIAKNTMYLFIRMLFLMILSLYTSRVVLNILGVEDYGIYNVVGGLVAMVGYINQALSSSTLRFIAFSIGHESSKQIRVIFNTSFVIHIILALIICVLGETIGLWFFYNKLNIPVENQHAAFVIYQLSIISTILVIISLPYNALIIAYERMSAFASLSILDAILKLSSVYLLYVISYDKLIVYGSLMLLTQFIYTLIYFIYCRKHFLESRINFIIDKRKSIEMIKFAGWSMFGCTAAISYTQGLNLLLNVFGGPIVNAARGLAVQVQGIVSNFLSNFQTAINPQIIKSYALNDYKYMINLICISSKYSFFLMLLIIAPLFINMEILLTWWLGEIPQYLTTFLKIILLISLVDSLSNSIMKSVDATGKIKRYHVIIGCTLMMILPCSYIALKLGYPLYSVFIIQLLFSFIALFLRLLVASPMIQLKITTYIKSVILVVAKVSVFSIIACYLLMNISFPSQISKVAITSAGIILSNTLFIWFLGTTEKEKRMITDKIKNVIKRIRA